jgi:hypothetical protein
MSKSEGTKSLGKHFYMHKIGGKNNEHAEQPRH